MSISRTFVTADTHGELHKLTSCLEQADFEYEHDTLIHLGDCVDRGPDSKGVVDLLLKIKHLIAIRGNHDAWMLEFINTGVHPMPSSFHETANSYFRSVNTRFTPEFIPSSHQQFFKRQLDYYLDAQNRFFCHAGCGLDSPVEEQEKRDFYLSRDLIKKAMSARASGTKLNDVNGFKQIFIGHTPTVNWIEEGKPIIKPIYAAQVINMDTGGAFGYKISLMDITTDEHILYQDS